MVKAPKLWFDIGDTLVYPGYGVGVVQELQERTIHDKVHTYCVIAFSEAGNESKVMIPVDNIKGVGLRALSTKKSVNQALDYLSDGQPEILLSWKDRFAAQSLETRDLGPEALATLMRDELESWGALIQRLNIRQD